MPQHEELGFNSQDRELLITLKIELAHIREDLRDGLARTARLESDRVTQHDFEGLMTDIDELRMARSADAGSIAQQAGRIVELEKLGPVVEGLRRQVWMASGAVGVIFFVARLIFRI